MKKWSRLLCTALTLAALLIVPPARAEKNVPGLTPRLPRTVTEYGVNYETKEWVPIRQWTYTCENGYPVRVDCLEYYLDAHFFTTHKYVFENGVPVARETYDGEDNCVTSVEYLNGWPYVITRRFGNGNAVGTDYFQYANGDGWFTLVLHEYNATDPDNPDVEDHAEEAHAVSVTVSNGLPVHTVNTGMYAHWGGETKKEWLRFNGTYTVIYDADGIAVSTSAVFRRGPDGAQDLFEVTRQNGLVTEAMALCPQDTGWEAVSKYVFTYTEEEMSPARYAVMINSFLLGEENNYYYFFWY